MKTNLVIAEEPKEFKRILKEYIDKANTEGYHIRDIKYSDNGKRYSALLLLIKK